MKHLWSPWRSKYIASFAKKPVTGRSRESLFTAAWRSKADDRNLVVWRGVTCFVMMNRYPYNSGHLMVVPVRQVADFQALSLVELAEMMQTVQRAMRALDEVVRPHGYNIGANIGRVAGAGVVDHVHMHIVPRWNGDTNFMPVLGDTKLISEDMKKTLKRLQKAFKKASL